MAGRRTTYALVALLAAIGGLTWAKWWPYAVRLRGLVADRAWPGASVLSAAGHAGSGPSLRGGWDFTVAYGRSIWQALVVALVVAAAIETLVSRRWMERLFDRRGGTVVGGLLSVPCMMCTCCSAPIARKLRRGGAPTSSVLAYWLGNPTLNPAVLAFLAIVAPWQWFATRLLVGLVLVFGLTALVGRLTGDGDDARLPAGEAAPARPRRFLANLLRLSCTLVPEYAVVVFAVGVFRGWLFPFDSGASHRGLLVLVLAALLGTLVVVPTAGEIPVLQGLAAAGAGAGVLGTLLITLPAVSLPSMVMVVRELSPRVTVAVAGAVAAAGLLAGAMLWSIG